MQENFTELEYAIIDSEWKRMFANAMASLNGTRPVAMYVHVVYEDGTGTAHEFGMEPHDYMTVVYDCLSRFSEYYEREDLEDEELFGEIEEED